MGSKYFAVRVENMSWLLQQHFMGRKIKGS